jgi:hypothetical protein
MGKWWTTGASAGNGETIMEKNLASRGRLLIGALIECGILALVLLGGVAVSTTSALGTVLYSQPGTTDACVPFCWTSAVGTDGTGFQTFDNFTLNQTSTITTVKWQGFYFDFEDPTKNPVSPSTISWDISFSEDNSGLPGAVLLDQTLPAASVTAAFLGISSFNGPVPVFSFTAVLPTPFVASAGEEFWFSPLSEQLSFNPFFSWSPASTDVDPTDTATVQTSLPGFSPSFRPSDRNFELDGVIGVPVPETSSLALLCTALVGFGVSRRRRMHRQGW